MSDLAVEFGKFNTCHDARGKFCSGSTYSRIQAVKELAAKDPRVAEAEKLNREGGDSRNWPGVQKDGHYTPKAHAENISIADSFMNPAAKAKDGEAPIAIILLGKPGAGKTTVVKSMGTTTPTTMINSDDIKDKIPGHKPNAAQVTHERSCDIARNYLAPAAIEARHNITFDMTDNQERVVKMAAELKAKGYKIGVIHVDVDNATSAERVYSRFQHTGRYVPVHVALSYGDKPEKSYQALKSSGLVDQWRKYDNSSYGKPPKQLDAGGKEVFKRGTVGSLGAGFGGGSSNGTPALGEGDGKAFGQEDRGEDVAKAGNGIMIAWFPPAELADKLAQEGGEKPEELHVTLAYLGKQEAFTDDQVELLKDTVEEYCSKYAPLQGTLGGNGRFPATPSSDDKDVLIKMVDVAMLEKFREELIEELADKGIPIVRNHGYTPHMTLAYVDQDYTGECVHLDTDDIVIDALTVAIGGERHVYPLNGEEVLKMEPTAPQVHSDKPLTDEEKKRKQVKKSDLEVEFGEVVENTFQAEIAKIDKDQQLVFGWVTITDIAGKPLVDTQGDLITPADMEKMAYAYVADVRHMGVMHEKVGGGELVESIVFTAEKQKALGIDLGRSGWWIGFHVTSPEVWARVKSGELAAFSIHGKGIRTKIAD